MSRALLVSAALLASPPALAGEVSDWLGGIGATSEALSVMDSYPEGPLSPGFRQAVAKWTREHLAASAQRSLDQAMVQCETRGEVSFVEPGTFGTTEAERTFEESLFMVESVYCLDSGTAAEAAEYYSSAHFRVNVMPLVTEFTLTRDQMCLRTEAKAGLLRATGFCHAIKRVDGPFAWGLAGWLTSNSTDPGIQPLYFRETTILFVDRPDGGVAGFRGVVTRSRDLGTLQRTVLRATVSAGHTRLEADLEASLSGGH